MCGISLYCSTKLQNPEELQRSMDSMRHRGPDAQGSVYKDIAGYHLGIGHNRLSILDLSEKGHQPMDVGLKTTLAYNGEVYNHSALRQRLQDHGLNTIGQSDTEVVLRLYNAFGVDSFAMLEGMFAFVLLDETNNKLFLVRDGLGIKPLYLFKDDNSLFASSEIRGLKSYSEVNIEVDHNDVFEFFNQGFLYEPATGFKDIKKLLPGHYLEFDLTNGLEKIVDFRADRVFIEGMTLEENLNAAIQQQLVADVPLGTFFSGGIDSSLIASYAKENDLFFARFEDDPLTAIDLQFSNAIADFLKKPLNVSDLSQNSSDKEALLRLVDFVAANTEELISDYTFLATYQLSKAAKEKGYTVMLSGMGGDEVFAGYPRYAVLKIHRWVKALSPLLNWCLKNNCFPRNWEKKFERLASYAAEKHWPSAYARLLGYFNRQELDAFFPAFETLSEHYKNRLDRIADPFTGRLNDKVKLAQFFDLSGFLSHNLMVADKASMLASIELRVPLLAEAIVAHGLSLPTKTLIKRRQLKYPLKALLAKRLPKRFTKRPKTGFNPPLDGLIRKIGKAQLKSEFEHAREYIRLDGIDDLLDEHFTLQANHTYKLWQLLYFSRWIRLHEATDKSGCSGRNPL